MERCPNCGASIRTGARFCTACGFRLEPAAAPQPSAGTIGQANGPATAIMTTAPAAEAVEQGSGTASGDHREPDVADSVASTHVTAQPDGQDAYQTGQAYADPGPDPYSSPDQDSSGSAAITDGPSMGQGDADPLPVAEQTDPDDATTVDDLDESVLAADDASVAVGDDIAAEESATGSTAEVDSRVGAGDSEGNVYPAQAVVDTEDEARTAQPDNWWKSLGDDDGAPAREHGDDVVIGSTVVGESSWPAGAGPGGFSPTMAGDGAASAGSDASASEDSRTQPEPEGVADNGTPKGDRPATDDGRDSDWEPWGTGTDVPATATAGAQLSYFPESTPQPGSQSADPGQDASILSDEPIGRVRMLVEQLQEVLQSMPAATATMAADSPSLESSTRLDEASQLLAAFPQSPLDDERLTELERLSTDLEGRDYDIRALTRFADQRQLILELAVDYRQHRDLIDQLRAVLSQGEPAV